jgi:hypothetical protein
MMNGVIVQKLQTLDEVLLELCSLFVSLTAREYEESMAMVQHALAERAVAKRGAA